MTEPELNEDAFWVEPATPAEWQEAANLAWFLLALDKADLADEPLAVEVNRQQCQALLSAAADRGLLQGQPEGGRAGRQALA